MSNFIENVAEISAESSAELLSRLVNDQRGVYTNTGWLLRNMRLMILCDRLVSAHVITGAEAMALVDRNRL